MGMSMLASCAALLLASAAFLAYTAVTFRESTVRTLSTQADIIGFNCISPLLFQDERGAGEVLAALRVEPQVTAAAVYNQEGRVFAAYHRDTAGGAFEVPPVLSASPSGFQFGTQSLSVHRPILFRGERIGTVYIESGLDELYGHLQRYVGSGAIMLSLSTLLAWFISSKLQRSLSQPITRLAETAQIVSREKDYSVRAPAPTSRDELGHLVDTFNEMLSQIQRRDVQQKQSEEEINRLFTLSQDMLCIAGFDGYFKKLNPAWEKALGYTLAELMAKPYAEFLHPDDRDVTRAEADKLAAGQLTIAFQNRYRCQDGSYKWLSWNSYPIPEEQLIYGSARDITTLKEGEEQIHKLNVTLEKQVLELDETNKELEAFTYSVSHDLRAPLRHIDGFSRILEDDWRNELDSSAQHYLQRIRDGARHMGQLVDDLLSLSRVSRQELRRQVTGMNSLVQEVQAELRTDTEGRNIEWQVANLPFTDCDPVLMKQVFANLLSNAVKYTRPREQAVIEVGVLPSDAEPVLFVRDNGVGFSMKYADKLFGVFQRLHRQEDFEGTGVGLATVQRILHKHGGRIWVEAELDRGACFYFTLGAVERDVPHPTATPAGVASG